MKKLLSWMLAALLVGGTSATFTSCSDDDNNSTASVTQTDREKLIEKIKTSLKTAAENVNLGSSEMINIVIGAYNEKILTNDAFDNKLREMFQAKIKESVIELGENDAQITELGYKRLATIDLVDLKHKFIENANSDGFDVEDTNDGFVLEFSLWTQNMANSPDLDADFKAILPYIKCRLNLKPTGTSYNVLVFNPFSSEQQAPAGPEPPEGKEPPVSYKDKTMAVMVKLPATFRAEFQTSIDNENWTTVASATISNTFTPSGTYSGGQFVNLTKDAWTISGSIQTDITFPESDNAAIAFSIKQDPVNDKATTSFQLVHNGLPVISASSVVKKSSEGLIDLTSLTRGSSVLDVITALLNGKSLESGNITVMNDLALDFKVKDADELFECRRAAANERHKGNATEEDIEYYTKQINNLISGKLTCKSLGQELDMKYKTVKFGIDYWSMPAFKFADQDDYTPLPWLFDAEELAYGINIVDRAMVPMSQSIILVRQFTEYIKKYLNMRPAPQEEPK